MARINIFEDSIIQCVTKLADGNPGAASCLCRLLEITFKNPHNLPINGANMLLLLDRWGIYGTDIYVLWNDICDGDFVKVLELLSATYLNLLNPAVLADACSRQDRSGKSLINIEQVVRNTKTFFPYFDNMERQYRNQDQA